ncbi:cysteine synthase CysK [Pelagophyceae sp. CCMP2097]|nr:cysteine synthase CysK [Pelagophyceae sp. CCMP2097]
MCAPRRRHLCFVGGVYSDVTQLVGNTPCVRISAKLCPPGVEVYAKLEYFNPLSSVKDRLAVSIIEEAERSGALQPGQTVVEATSGNTGIAVAMVCAQRGYPCVITMAQPFSVERRKLMRMLGAKVIVTPGKGTGMVLKAEELCKQHGWFLCHQFETEANWKFHEQTTGPEIVADFAAAGKTLTHWVTGYGTGGTFHGAGKHLKENIPGLQIILGEPAAAGLLKSGIPSERKADGSPKSSHPAFAPHPIQGWTPDFIPKVLDDAPDGLYDVLLPIPGDASIATSKALAANEGIFTGISGGGTMWAALQTAKTAAPGSVILAMIADTGERYLSTPLFADIEAEMNAEELEIATSTPSFQLVPGTDPVFLVEA